MKKKQNVINIGCRLNSFESSVIKRILDSNKIKNKVVKYMRCNQPSC